MADFRVEFQSSPVFNTVFGETSRVSDGGYERGYAAGYEKGNTDGQKAGYASGYENGEDAGLKKGYAEGLAARAYETWTITLTDGSIVEKEVALL